MILNEALVVSAFDLDEFNNLGCDFGNLWLKILNCHFPILLWFTSVRKEFLDDVNESVGFGNILVANLSPILP